MKYIGIVAVVLLAIISLAAGLAKVMQVPQEVAFFQQTGFGANMLIAFGTVQILGGLLALVPKTRKLGLLIMALMFLFSAIQIFITGNTIFGLASLIPAALAVILVKRQHRRIS